MRNGWAFSIGWLRFTVPSGTVDEIKSLVGGDWVEDQKGFQGYRHCWLSRGDHGGLGRIASGARRAPKEVHVDLSQELLSDWTYDKFQTVTQWVLAQKGHVGRIDIAMDDRTGVIGLDRIFKAVKVGQCVSHFRKCQVLDGLDIGNGQKTGKTVALGSRQSDTYLRIYDKAMEQRTKGKAVSGKWIRWEMEWKNERANAVALALSTLAEDAFQKWAVGVFRTTVDFRDCTREDDPKDRCYAPLLDWWTVLTEGMQKAKLQIVKATKHIHDVKVWAEKSLAPMLGLLCAHPEAGERWLVKTIVEGVDRWRAKHVALLQEGQDLAKTKRKLRWWRPSDGFSAAYAPSGA